MSKRAAGQTDNLADHEDLTEEVLLHELEVRIQSDRMYTYVGEILVAVNPFKIIEGLYGPTNLTKYKGFQDKTALPPYVLFWPS